MTAMAAYEAGLAGAECWLRTGDGARRRLPVTRWTADADHRDHDVLAAVLNGMGRGGSILDVGCGPGRMTAALTAAGQGIHVLGIDVSARAVALTRARGGRATRADVFEALSGRWDRVLLADGNLGIGGDPAALLRRVRELLVPGGRVVADVQPDGGVVREAAWLEAVDPAGSPLGGPVPWAWVGADAVPGLCAQAGLELHAVMHRPGRRIVIWEAPS